jgi:hypothetical protein
MKFYDLSLAIVLVVIGVAGLVSVGSVYFLGPDNKVEHAAIDVIEAEIPALEHDLEGPTQPQVIKA